MKQTTFAQGSCERYAKTIKRAVFLSDINQVVPWPMLCDLVASHYPKARNGRPPIGVELTFTSISRMASFRMVAKSNECPTEVCNFPTIWMKYRQQWIKWTTARWIMVSLVRLKNIWTWQCKETGIKPSIEIPGNEPELEVCIMDSQTKHNQYLGNLWLSPVG